MKIGRKPDYMKWLRIRLAKDDKPELSNRDLQDMFNASPNTIIKALDHKEDDIRRMIENTMSMSTFEPIDTEDISIERYLSMDLDRNAIEIAKEWISKVFKEYEEDYDYEGDEMIITNKNFYTESTCYQIKHWLENTIKLPRWEFSGMYMTQEEFIVAMVESGYKARYKDEPSTNVYFNVNPRGYYFALGYTHVLSDADNQHEYGRFMKTENHNAEGFCSQQYCSKLPTHHYDISFGSRRGSNIDVASIFIPFCLEHGSVFEGMKEAQKELMKKD